MWKENLALIFLVSVLLLNFYLIFLLCYFIASTLFCFFKQSDWHQYETPK